MSEFFKQELQARLGSNYHNYAKILESWCRGNLLWEDLKLMVAKIMDPETLDLHNRYINSMVSRLESDPTASDTEPPKKKLRDISALDALELPNVLNVGNEMDTGVNIQNAFDHIEAFSPLDPTQGQETLPIRIDVPWYGPPSKDDVPNLCMRLGRLPTQQELHQNVLNITQSAKLSLVSQEAVELLLDSLTVYMESVLQHMIVTKRPFRCSQLFRVKPPFCNEPHSFHERLYVNPVLLQQPKLLTRRPSTELHSNGACDFMCPNSSVQSIDFYPFKSKSTRHPDAPLRMTRHDVYRLVELPEPTVVNRSNIQRSYQLIPDARSREVIRCTLMDTFSGSHEFVEKAHGPLSNSETSVSIEEMDSDVDE